MRADSKPDIHASLMALRQSEASWARMLRVHFMVIAFSTGHAWRSGTMY